MNNLKRIRFIGLIAAVMVFSFYLVGYWHIYVALKKGSSKLALAATYFKFFGQYIYF